MAKRERRNPDLKLVPEEQKVLSTDFNLFYVPQEKPLPAGVENFTKSLDSFINNGATKAVLGAEVKMKKSESAKALKEYNDLKLKFRDAVKNGDIDKTANPYYLEKYKELTLNSFASEFTERALKKYNELGVGENITEGAFESFYKDQLKAFIKEKNLGFFKPEELEKGFFKDTSAYRNQLEATHKQNLLEKFNENFDSKIKDRVVGTIEKYKNFDTNLLSEAEIAQGVTKWDKIADGLQLEIGELLNLTGDGRASIDTIFDGLELYVTSTDDYEFALKLIQNVPELLIGGTDTVENIGRIKNKKQELTDLLIEKQNEKLNEQVKFDAVKDKIATVETHNYLENTLKENPDFSIAQWLNDKSRTDAERKAGEQYRTDQLYDGGNSDDPDIINEIEELLDDRDYAGASALVSKARKDGDIRKSTYDSYKTTTIPNSMQLEGNVYFESFYISGQFEAFSKMISSGKMGGDVEKAITARAWLRRRLLSWLDAHEGDPQYDGNKIVFPTKSTN